MNSLAVWQGTLTHCFPQTGQSIRSIIVGGDPWFVGRDIADALGYANSRKAVRDHVPAGHRKGNESFPLSDLGLHPQTVLIDEAGMYRLILQANTDRAEQFQEWVTAQVLPEIRRTGSYSGHLVPALDSPEAILQLAAAYHEAAKRLVGVQQRVVELEPGAEAWEALADAAGDYSLRDAAHILNRDPAVSTGQNRLMTFIRGEGMVDRKGIPYARYSRYLVERPISYSHPHTGEPVLKSQIRITVDGLAYLRKRLGGGGHPDDSSEGT